MGSLDRSRPSAFIRGTMFFPPPRTEPRMRAGSQPQDVMQNRILLAATLAVAGLAASCGNSSPEKLEGGTTVETLTGNGAEAADAEAGASQVADLGGSFTGPAEASTAPSTAEQKAVTPGGGVPESVSVGSVNPNLAAALRADPGKMAKGSIEGLVTFGDLSLVGVDLDALLDYLYKPETDKAKSFEFPDAVKAQAGKDKALIGYMIPLEYKPKSDEIVIFMLVRDLMSCCFGGVPRPDEWVYVEMVPDKTTQLYPYMPVVVRGELIVGRLEDEFGFATGVYTIKGEDVSPFEPPSAESADGSGD